MGISSKSNRKSVGFVWWLTLLDFYIEVWMSMFVLIGFSWTNVCGLGWNVFWYSDFHTKTLTSRILSFDSFRRLKCTTVLLSFNMFAIFLSFIDVLWNVYSLFDNTLSIQLYMYLFFSLTKILIVFRISTHFCVSWCISFLTFYVSIKWQKLTFNS